MRKNPPVQEILDKQGYIVANLESKHQVGDIIAKLPGNGRWREVNGPMIVIGQSNIKELRIQAEKYFKVPKFLLDYYYYKESEYIYRISAE